MATSADRLRTLAWCTIGGLLLGDGGCFVDVASLSEKPIDAGADASAGSSGTGGGSGGMPDSGDQSCAALGGSECAEPELCLVALVAAADIASCCPVSYCLPSSVAQGRLMAHARRAPGAVDIDGMIDDWVGAERVPVTKVALGNVPSAADFEPKFSAQWDDSALYVLVEVTDDVLWPTDGAGIADDDEAEVFVDLDPRDLGNPSYDTTENQLFVRQSGQVVEFEAHAWGWTAAAAFDASGSPNWKLELSIPWSNRVAGVPAANTILGFDLAADDDDDGGARETQMFWNDSTGFAYDNASLFGLIRLDP